VNSDGGESALFCRERRIGREPEMTEGVAFVSGISPHSPGGWESAHLAGDPTLAPNQKRGLGRLGAKTLLQHVQQIVVGYSLNLVRNALSTLSVLAFDDEGSGLGGDE
jgi:hypothetical protein